MGDEQKLDLFDAFVIGRYLPSQPTINVASINCLKLLETT
jgi:hypothetical protein